MNARRSNGLLVRRIVLAAVLGFALAGCAQNRIAKGNAADRTKAVPTDSAGADGEDADGSGALAAIQPPPRIENLPKQELTPQILYQMLLAEIAGQRGDLNFSTRAYIDLARTTRDPRIAKRAAEVAMFSRQNDAAVEAARLWAEVDPESPQAQQMLAGVLVGTNRLDEAQQHVAKLLEQEGPALPGALLRLNRLFARQVDKAQVSQMVDKLTEPYLNVPEAHLARGEAALNAGDNTKAVQAADQALKLRPTWETAVLLKAQAQRASSPEQSVETLKTFLSKNPKAREVRLNYARSLVNDKQYEKARAEFQKLLADFPDNSDVIYAVGVLSMQLNDFTAADKNLRKLLEMEYGEPNLIRLYLGQIAEEQKRTADALKWYGSVQPGEQYVPAQLRIANVLAQDGKIDEARRSLQQASATSNGDRIQFLLGEAQILRDSGRTEEAFNLLDQSLNAQPNQPDLLYETALLAERLGRIDVLEANLRHLIQIKPDHAQAYNALGYSFADRNERLDEAQKLIAKALELTPEDPFILDSMGWVLYRKGDLPGALTALKRAYGLRQDPEIAAHLGEVLWTMDRRDEAKKTWRDAAQANPKNEVLANAIKKFIP